jgi:glycosyltransferase involved in cell wall biosynthesis
VPFPHDDGFRSVKISVITVCLNSRNTIRDTIRSVLSQTGVDIEYILIDGGSRDGTLEIIEEYRDRIDMVVSEPDDGIYYAMNKGLRLASGDIVGFLNSDDFYSGHDVLSTIAERFEVETIDCCYGDLCYVSPKRVDSVVRYWKSSPFRPETFRLGWAPPHPTFFVRRAVYERHGDFDTRYRIAADVELMMRFLEVARIAAVYVPTPLVYMRLGGETNRSSRNVVRQNQEILHALRNHGLRASLPGYLRGKILSRVLQFFVRPPATP